MKFCLSKNILPKQIYNILIISVLLFCLSKILMCGAFCLSKTEKINN